MLRINDKKRCPFCNKLYWRKHKCPKIINAVSNEMKEVSK